jgi:hypothetical protein
MVYTTKDLTVYNPKGVLTTQPLPVLNIPELSLDNLISELHKTVNSGKWVIFKGWQNKRLELDADRQNWIIRHIQNLGLTAEELAKTKASIILSSQMVADLVEGYYEEARQKFELSAQQHLTALKQEHDNRRKMDDEAVMRQLLIQEKSFLNQSLKWQAEEQKYNSDLAKLRAKLAGKIIDEFSFKNIDARQVFIIIEMLKEASNQSNIMEADAKWEMLKEQARQEKSKADIAEALSIKDIENLKNA